MRRRDDFEPELLARITHPGRVRARHRHRRPSAWWWQIPLIACFAALLAGVWWLRPGGHDASLTTLARQTAQAIQTGAPSELDGHTVTPADTARLLVHLTDLKEALAKEGVQWDQAVPVAFGGARARVSHPDAPPGGMWASVGNLYLDAKGSLVAVEYGARRESGAYLLTDFWHAEVVGATSLAAAENHARAAYRTFLEQDAEAGEGARLRSTRFVFLSLR